MRHLEWILRNGIFFLCFIHIRTEGCDEVTACLDVLYGSATPCAESSRSTLQSCFEDNFRGCTGQVALDLKKNFTDTNSLCENPCNNNLVTLPCGLDKCTPVSEDTWDYMCTCRPGFMGDRCETRIDLCGSDACPDGSTCLNYPSKKVCLCPAGYQWNETTGNCEDINECLNAANSGCQQMCENAIGTYVCKCHDGYSPSEDGPKTCVENDQFQCSDSLGCMHGCKLNMLGEEECFCFLGYEVDQDDSTKCAGVNACNASPSPCEFNGKCVNEDDNGRFSCGCPSYKILDNDGLHCRDCAPEKYGHMCDNTCDCENALACHPRGGCRSSCKVGWGGSDCETEVNFCNAVDCGNGMCKPKTLGYECDCAQDYHNMEGSTSKPCIRIDECVHSYDNDCQAGSNCRNIVDGGYVCLCPEEGDPPDGCIVATDCPNTDDDPCAPGGQCRSANDQEFCECLAGYRVEGNTCKDIDECNESEVSPCQKTCKNTNGSYTCECDVGEVVRSDGTCADENECATIPNACPAGVSCMNQVPSYTCLCATGFEFKIDTRECQNIDECSTDVHDCMHQCEDTEGDYDCSCNDGYDLGSDDKSCVDTDECATAGHECPAMISQCENTVPGYKCACVQGYVEDEENKNCNNIDECDLDMDRCQHICTDNTGSYTCSCNEGYSLASDGKMCTDMNECNSDHNCPMSSTCVNTRGSYICQCTDGFLYKDDTNTCESAESCSEEQQNECEEPASCHVVDSTVTCTCPINWVLDDDGDSCIDINECTETRGHPCEKDCENKDGGYKCSCDEGETLASNNHTCQDIDKCKGNHTCPAGSTCINLPQTYICMCPAGYLYDSTTNMCEDINLCENVTCPDGEGPCVDLVDRYVCACGDSMSDPSVFSMQISIPGNYSELIPSDKKEERLNAIVIKVIDHLKGDSAFTDAAGENAAGYSCLISQGSVLADFAIVVASDLSVAQRGKLIDLIAMRLKDNASIPIGNDDHPINTVSLVNGNETVGIVDACSYFTTFQLCTNLDVCKVIKGEPRCVCPEEDCDNTVLDGDNRLLVIIASSVCGVLLLVFIVVAACLCYNQNKYKNEKIEWQNPYRGADFVNGPPVAHSIPNKPSFRQMPNDPDNPFLRMNYHQYRRHHGATQDNTWGYAKSINTRSSESWAGRNHTGWTPASSGQVFHDQGNNQKGAGLFSQSNKGADDHYFFQAR